MSASVTNAYNTEIQGCVTSEDKLVSSDTHDRQVNAEGYVMCSRYLYFQIQKGLLTFESIKTLECSSVYAALFEIGGRAEIWKCSLNFATGQFVRTLKLRQPLTEHSLSICYEINQ